MLPKVSLCCVSSFDHLSVPSASFLSLTNNAPGSLYVQNFIPFADYFLKMDYSKANIEVQKNNVYTMTLKLMLTSSST